VKCELCHSVHMSTSIAGFDGYSISNRGAVHSLLTGRALVYGKTSSGYSQVHLYEKGKRTPKYVHTLVAEAFIGPRPSYRHQCCHNDGDKTHNCAANLRWDTIAGNAKDIVKHGTQKGEKNPQSKLSAEDVLRIREMRKQGVSGTRIAKMFGLSHRNHVYDVATGKLWSHIDGKA
jgi:hypothetical protein